MKHIPLIVAVVAVVALLVILLNRPRPAEQNTEALRILQGLVEDLQQKNAQLEREGVAIDSQYRALRNRDSLLLVNYEARLARDRQTIEQLKKIRDEKTKAIDGADDDELRRILAGHK